MFTFVPHSCPLSHIDDSLWEGFCTLKENKKLAGINRKDTGEYHSEDSAEYSEDSFDRNPLLDDGTILKGTASNSENGGKVVKGIADTVSPSNPRKSPTTKDFNTKTSVVSPGHSSISSADSAFCSLNPSTITGSESTDTLETSKPDLEKPLDMLSPANKSSFNYTDFTCVNNSTIVCRLPSNHLLVAPLVEPVSSPCSSPSSPKKYQRSHRRCVHCGGLIHFGKLQCHSDIDLFHDNLFKL